MRDLRAEDPADLHLSVDDVVVQAARARIRVLTAALPTRPED